MCGTKDLRCEWSRCNVTFTWGDNFITCMCLKSIVINSRLDVSPLKSWLFLLQRLNKFSVTLLWRTVVVVTGSILSFSSETTRTEVQFLNSGHDGV